MTTITADWFQTQINKTDTDISNAECENILQQAIDTLNTFGAGISDLSGTSPNLSLSASSAQAGAIAILAKYSTITSFRSDATVVRRHARPTWPPRRTRGCVGQVERRGLSAGAKKLALGTVANPASLAIRSLF